MSHNKIVSSVPSSSLSRRGFLYRTSAVAASLSVVPASILGRGATPPSGKLNVACIGVGGRGAASVGGVRGENIVALCDVDVSRAAAARGKNPKAAFFQDFRRMFDKMEKEIDAVTVATPDHTHAVAAMAAIRRSKHVFCEKPLAHSMLETRTLTEAAREMKVATQLGNQGHSSNSIREFCEMIWDGAIGTVREAHAFVQSSYTPRYRVRPPETPAVPTSLDWGTWLGPAPERPYHPVYHPGKWRGWVDFGTGITGDWTCHVLDPIFWALDLGAPTSAIADASDYDDPKIRAETCPPACMTRYDFPAKGDRPSVKVFWYEGDRQPPRPPQLEANRKLPRIGAVIIGDKGAIMHGSHGAGGAQILPATRWNDYERPPRTLERSKGHHADWLIACKGGKPSSASFEYGGPLTEVAMLGVLAQRFNGEKLLWDTKALRITNHPEADRLLRPPMRQGWAL